MMFNIKAFLPNGTLVFDSQTYWVPHKGDELEAAGCVFVVDSVRYKLYSGVTHSTDVELRLSYK